VKAAIYARVSTRDRQDARNQLDQLHSFASANGYDMAGEYIDQESGGTAERPEFKRLFQDARRRCFDLVIFWSLDRFSREGARETLNHLNNLTSDGVQFRSLGLYLVNRYIPMQSTI